MIEFRNIKLSDKPWIDELLSYNDFRGAEFCFTNLFIWESVFSSRIARFNDFLLLKSGEGENTKYLIPVGRGVLRDAIEYLKQDAIERGIQLKIIGIPKEKVSEISELFPEASINEERNSFDYIYESEKMITLSGKKLQPKRNHLARFKELPGWSYEEITRDNISECVEFNKLWCKETGICGEDPSLESEMCAVGNALANYFELGLKGGLLRLDGKVVAYTVGEKINSDTVIIHIEKAFAGIRGCYQMINREFAERIASEVKYINREDDAGDLGLRQAKMSYYPVFLQEKYSALIK